MERMLENKEKSEDQALKLTAKLNGEQEPSKIQRLNSIPCQCDKSSQNEDVVKQVIRDIIDEVINRVTDLEIDCTQPEIRVSPAHRRSQKTVEIEIEPEQQTSKKAEKEAETPQRGSSAPIAFRSSRSSSGLKRVFLKIFISPNFS